MWLADDDEIDVVTIKNLYSILCLDEKATTAVPYWLLYNDKLEKKLLRPSFFDIDSVFKEFYRIVTIQMMHFSMAYTN